MNLSQKDKKYIWHPFTPLIPSTDPLLIESGEGVYLNTFDGRKIIDAISSWWVNLHGHSHPRIAKAIADQAHKLEHVIFAGFTHEPAIQLAENLLSILPENQSRIFFSDNGSTAVEVALKIAIQHWFNKGVKKSKVVAFQDAYHGDTFGSMSVGARGKFNRPFSHYLFDVVFLDSPSTGDPQQIADSFSKEINNGNVAAFIFEPLVQAAGGMKMYPAKLLNELISIAKNKNVICIADEVFTGFGRTGKLFASDYLEVSPDIIAMSKGITGGSLPLGATSCSNEVLEPFHSNDLHKTLFHGHSYTANPISCAAANASFELLTEPRCIEAIKRISSQHEKFKNSIHKTKLFKEVRTMGSILAIELKTGQRADYFNSIRDQLYSYFIERNILLRPLGNVIYVLPPYVINDDELNTVYSAIESLPEKT
jgi:adenosylmethionine-8-amino-7-oxononanoate aminotransferase